jgi:hypothetical protein
MIGIIRRCRERKIDADQSAKISIYPDNLIYAAFGSHETGQTTRLMAESGSPQSMVRKIPNAIHHSHRHPVIA